MCMYVYTVKTFNFCGIKIWPFIRLAYWRSLILVVFQFMPFKAIIIGATFKGKNMLPSI